MKIGGLDAHGSAINMALVTATLLLAQQIAGKAVRDTLFLSHFPATDLPKAMLVAAFLSLIAVLSMTRLMVRYGPARVVPWGFGLSALLFGVEWLTLGISTKPVVMLVYLHTSVLGAILISGFWSVLNERFDPYTAKHAFGSITAAATLGGVLGAVIAQEVAAYSTVDNLLLVLAIISGIGLLTLNAIGGEARGARPVVDSSGFAPGVRVLARSPYLRWVALLVLSAAMLSTLLDYALKAEAAAQLQTKDELIAFFSKFYAAVGLVTFLIQPILGRPLLRRFGLGASMAVLPLVVLVSAGGAALFSRLWTVVLAKGAEMVSANSFYRSGFELLYTPVTAADKRSVKALVDVGAQRIGDALGSGLVLLLLWSLPVLPAAWILVPAMLIALLSLIAIRRLHHGYVEQLEANLRNGAVTLGADEVVDYTTRQTLAESHMPIDRGSLLARIEDFQQRRVAEAQASEAGYADALDGLSPALAKSPLLHACAVLEQGDKAAIRRLLAAGTLDQRLVPLVLPLLADDDLYEPVTDALRPLAAKNLGQLIDCLLDPDAADNLCRRLPRLMAAADSQRAVYGLMAGLSDARFEVRYYAGRALSWMLSRNERLRLDDELMLEVIRREVGVGREEWEAESRRAAALDATLAESVTATHGGSDDGRSLEHVFTLLGLVLEPRVLQLTMRAVRSHDKRMRGTALEYLENVLPEDIRKGLWRHLQGE
jgi:hypothetical protein